MENPVDLPRDDPFAPDGAESPDGVDLTIIA